MLTTKAALSILFVVVTVCMVVFPVASVQYSNSCSIYCRWSVKAALFILLIVVCVSTIMYIVYFNVNESCVLVVLVCTQLQLVT